MRTTERVPQLLPQMVAGTRCQNEVAAATYFLIEVAAATSHNHAYCANRAVLNIEKKIALTYLLQTFILSIMHFTSANLVYGK